MRLFELLESTITDTVNPALKEFLDDAGVYDDDIFIHFTNDRTIASSNRIDVDDNNGMTVIPLNIFKRHIKYYRSFMNKRYARILSPTDSILHINDINERTLITFLRRLGVHNPSEEINRLAGSVRTDNNAYGRILYHALTKNVIDGVIDDTPSNDIVVKLKRLGFDGIYDTSQTISRSIISKKYQGIGYIYTSSSIRNISYADLKDVKDVGDSLLGDNELYHTLADKIANRLETNLNIDDPYHEGVHHYYWTVDGIQIRITTLLGNASSESSDNVYFFVQADTPYGILTYTSSSDQDFDNIADQIGKNYRLMDSPIGAWKEKDRDVFFNNNTLDHKDNANRLKDLLNEVKEHYPNLYTFARRFNITIKPLSYYSDYDKSFIPGIIDQFGKSVSARNFMQDITAKGTITEIPKIEFFFPRNTLPKTMTIEELNKLALVYDIAKKENPSRRGWRLFINN